MEQAGSNSARSRDKRAAALKRSEKNDKVEKAEKAEKAAKAEKADKTGKGERAAGAKVDLGVLPKLMGYNLRRAHQASWRTYVSFIGEHKIRPGLFSLLCLVRFNAGIAQIEIGTHLGVDKASIVALLDRLERAGLIERRRSTRDRRRQGITLTEAGAVEFDSLMVQVRQLERHMASRFNKQELDQFLGFLHRMYS